MIKACVLLVAALTSLSTFAQEANLPRVAVTDLAYEEKVAHYFSVSEHKNKGTWNNSNRSSAAGSAASSNETNSGSTDFESFSASGEMIRIDRGELRKFTGDIKGAMLKSGVYRLVQGKPYLEKEQQDEKKMSRAEKLLPRMQRSDEKLFDVIDRIKKGYFPNADYVLFSTITSIEPRQELNPIQGTTSSRYSGAMELVVECSLINTKTYEIKAAFSAMGEGEDSRIMHSAGQVAHLSKGKIMRDVSKSLGEDVATQLEAQFDPTQGKGAANRRNKECGQDRARDSDRQCPVQTKAPDKIIEYR